VSGFAAPRNTAAVVDAVLAQLPTALQGLDQRVIDGGSAHRIVLIGDAAAIRIARDEGAGALMTRRQRLVDSLPELAFRVPRSLSTVVTIDGTSGVAVEYIPGRAAPAGAAAAGELLMLLSELQRVALEPLFVAPLELGGSLLAQPLEFCGGAAWFDIQVERVIPLLPYAAWARARAAVDDLAGLDPQTDTLSHGDLAGHNVLWESGRIAGVIDWDLASRSDRSADIAALAGWHGFESLEAIVAPEDLARARVRHATFELQRIAFLLLHGRPGEEVERAVERAGRRFLG
jgi:hypothetical protein